MKHRRPPRSVGAKTERCAVYHAGGHRRRRACGTRRPDLRLCRSQRTILWRWRVTPRPRRSPGSRTELKQESPKRITSAAAPAFGRANPVARCFDLKEDGGLAVDAERGTMWIDIMVLGLGVGILVGLMGIGGGIVLVPAMVHLLGMDQHLAQGTSLFLQLPPIGAGALYHYWKEGHVNWGAGVGWSAGLFVGGYFGSGITIPISSEHLRRVFGGFFIVFAVKLLARRSGVEAVGKTNCLSAHP